MTNLGYFMIVATTHHRPYLYVFFNDILGRLDEINDMFALYCCVSSKLRVASVLCNILEHITAIQFNI